MCFLALNLQSSAALVGGVGLLEGFRTTDRAGGVEVGEDLVLEFFRAGVGFVDDLLGVVDDLLHELVTLELALLHLTQFVFPVAGEAR